MMTAATIAVSYVEHGKKDSFLYAATSLCPEDLHWQRCQLSS